jgi:hypothetical protein
LAKGSKGKVSTSGSVLSGSHGINIENIFYKEERVKESW